MPFDIRQLRYAIAAADHGSFYRAARALEVEQSTLSRAVVKLERSLGAPIFERSRSGLVLTTAGGAFLGGARPMVATAEKLTSMMRDAGQGRAGILRLGLNSAISAGNLRATTFAWRDAHPEVDVQCVEADRRVLFAGLDSAEVDIAILMGTAPSGSLRAEPLWSERILVAVPACHRLAEHQVVHWTDLQAEQILLTTADPGSDIRDLVLGKLALNGRKPNIRLCHCSRETILSVLGNYCSISIVCEGATGALYPDVVYRPIHGEQGPALVGYCGYWRPDNRNPAVMRFLSFVRQRYALSFALSEASSVQEKEGPANGEN
ncbi:LysR substrate-binding domain-containing protein [Blastomonas sp. CACIA14H2]|uniref:LysR substrate-binding domain-containing protein n=1 Tax=Blastomonas sp. CACIA14H2 TaxID=1419876 RepID=UPI00405927F5